MNLAPHTEKTAKKVQVYALRDHIILASIWRLLTKTFQVGWSNDRYIHHTFSLYEATVGRTFGRREEAFIRA